MSCAAGSDDAVSSHVAPIIAYHQSPLSQKFGAPRQPNLVPIISVIEMMAPYDSPAAFVGLEDFSHIWVSWQFHHNFINKKNPSAESPTDKFRAQVRPPRLGGNQKIGVFASRSMYRPSGLGLSVVKLEQVSVIDGRVRLLISGADMIDGTPIIDIKPYVAYSDAISHAESGFAPTIPEPLNVTITESATAQFAQWIQSSRFLTESTIAAADLIADIQHQLVFADLNMIKALIAQDPRPAYRQDDISKTFVMRYKSVDVSFKALAVGHLQIIAIQPV